MIFGALIFLLSLIAVSINGQNTTQCIDRDEKSLYVSLMIAQMEEAFYTNGLAQFSVTENVCDDFYQLLILRSRIKKQVLDLSNMLTNLGVFPLSPCSYNFDVRSQQDFLQKARLISKIKLSYLAYASAQAKDPSIRLAFASMVTGDAKKSALIDFLLHDGLSARNMGMEVPLSENQVMSMLSGLITTCPFDLNDLGVGSYAKVRTVRDVKAGDVLFVDFASASRFREAVYCNFVFEDQSLLVPLSPEKTACQVPANATGDIYVAMVTGKGKIGDCCHKGYIVAGPTVVSIVSEKCTFQCPTLPDTPIPQGTVTFSVRPEIPTTIPNSLQPDSLTDPRPDAATIPTSTPVPVITASKIPAAEPVTIPSATPVKEPELKPESILTPRIVIPYNPLQTTSIDFKHPYVPTDVTTSVETPTVPTPDAAVIPIVTTESTFSTHIETSSTLAAEPAIVPTSTAIDTSKCRIRTHTSLIPHETSETTTCSTSYLTTSEISSVVAEPTTQVIHEVSETLQPASIETKTYVEQPIQYSSLPPVPEVVPNEVQTSAQLPVYETRVIDYATAQVQPPVEYETSTYITMETLHPAPAIVPNDPHPPVQMPAYETRVVQPPVKYETSTYITMETIHPAPARAYDTHHPVQVPAYETRVVQPTVEYETSTYITMETIHPAPAKAYDTQPPVIANYETKIEQIPQYVTSALPLVMEYATTAIVEQYPTDIPIVPPNHDNGSINIAPAEVATAISVMSSETTTSTISDMAQSSSSSFIVSTTNGANAIVTETTSTTSTSITSATVTSVLNPIAAAQTTTTKWGLDEITMDISTETPVIDIPIADITITDSVTGTPDVDPVGVGIPLNE